MRHVSEAKSFVFFENFIKASEIGANAVIFNVGSTFGGDVYKLFKVEEAYDWKRYNRKYYKSITKSLMLFEKKLSVVVISYIEDFTYFIEFIEEDISKAGGGAKNLKIIKHIENYETVNKLVGYVYVRPDSYIRIADGNETGRIIEQLIKQGWKLKMLA